jgi:hypothetical protein
MFQPGYRVSLYQLVIHLQRVGAVPICKDKRNLPAGIPSEAHEWLLKEFCICIQRNDSQDDPGQCSLDDNGNIRSGIIHAFPWEVKCHRYIRLANKRKLDGKEVRLF